MKSSAGRGCATASIVFRDGSGQREIMQVSEIPLKGAHNLENVLAAVVPGADGMRRRKDSPGGPRLQGGRAPTGIRGHASAESITTTTPRRPTWTRPSRRWNPFPANIHLILGGKDKGSDYTVLNDLLRQRVKRVYTIGAAAAKIESQIKGPKSCTLRLWKTPFARPMPARSPAMWCCWLLPAPASISSRATSTAGEYSKRRCRQWRTPCENRRRPEPKQSTSRNHNQQFSKTLRGEMNVPWQSA